MSWLLFCVAGALAVTAGTMLFAREHDLALFVYDRSPLFHLWPVCHTTCFWVLCAMHGLATALEAAGRLARLVYTVIEFSLGVSLMTVERAAAAQHQALERRRERHGRREPQARLTETESAPSTDVSDGEQHEQSHGPGDAETRFGSQPAVKMSLQQLRHRHFVETGGPAQSKDSHGALLDALASSGDEQ